MEPLYGFMLFAAVTIVVSIVAGKRSGTGIGFLYFIVIFAAAFGLVVLTSNITDRNGMMPGFAAFLAPIIGLVVALSTATSERRAVLHGESGEYKKCPFCAESVRKEAVKCKHCASDLSGNSGVAQ
jgi:thiol:disulfide interchange protein